MNISINVGNNKTLGITVSHSIEQMIIKEYIKERMFKVPPEYIAKELNKPISSIRDKYENLCTPTKYVNLKKKIKLMREDINLLLKENPSIIKTFTSPGETYTHPDFDSIEIEKIPLLEAVVSDLPPEKHPTFLEMINKLNNPTPPKFPIYKSLYPYSSTFDDVLTSPDCIDDNMKFKIIRKLKDPDYIDEETSLHGEGYLRYFTINQMANVIFSINKSIINHFAVEYLNELSSNIYKSETYKEVSKSHEEAKNFEEKLKSGNLSLEQLKSISNLKYEYGAFSISKKNIILLSAYKDLSDEGKSIKEISKILKLSVEEIFDLKNSLNKRWKSMRFNLPELEYPNYIHGRNYTCYEIAKIIKEKTTPTPIKPIDVYDSLKKKHGSLEELGKIRPETSIISYIKKINNDGGCNAYIKWFEGHYE